MDKPIACACANPDCAKYGCLEQRRRHGGPGFIGHVGHVTTGCVCPGDATPYCKNPLCPRKAPPSPFAPSMVAERSQTD